VSNNTVLNTGAGGDTVRTIEKGAFKVASSVIDKGGSGAESLVSDANPLPVQLTDGTNTQGTSAHPVRTDPTGTTIQPVSGTIEVTNDVGNPLPVSASALPLPTGAASSAAQATIITALAAILSALGTVEITNDAGNPLPVSGTVGANLAAGTNLIGAVAAALRSDALMNGTTLLTPKFKTVTLSATGELVALVNAKKIRVVRYSLMADAACTVYFKSHTGGQISGTKYLGALGGAGGTFCAAGHFETASGEALDLVITGTANVSVDVTYVEV